MQNIARLRLSEGSFVAEIKFHFQKSPHFTEVPVHGAFGGINPQGGSIYMAVYSERSPIPTAITHEISAEGHLSDEKKDKRETKDGVIRTVHFGMHMTTDQAVAIRDWLNERLAEHEKLPKAGDV